MLINIALAPATMVRSCKSPRATSFATCFFHFARLLRSPFVSRTSPLLPLASLPTEENLSSGAAFLADRGRCLAGSTKRLSRRRRRSVRPTGRPGVQPWVLPRGRDDGAKITSARRGARGKFPCSVGGLNPSLAELPGSAVEVGRGARKTVAPPRRALLARSRRESELVQVTWFSKFV